MFTHYIQGIVLNAKKDLWCVCEEQNYANLQHSSTKRKLASNHNLDIIRCVHVHVCICMCSQWIVNLLREGLLSSIFETLLSQVPSMVLYTLENLVKWNEVPLKISWRLHCFWTGTLRSVIVHTSKLLHVSTCSKCQPDHGLEMFTLNWVLIFVETFNNSFI